MAENLTPQKCFEVAHDKLRGIIDMPSHDKDILGYTMSDMARSKILEVALLVEHGLEKMGDG